MKEKPITDLSLASYLSTINHKILAIVPNGKRLEFVFENSPKLEEDILNYYNHAARVDPLRFIESYRNLKGLAARN